MTEDEREIFVIDEYPYLTKADKPVQENDRIRKRMECKISYIPVKLCEFMNENLILATVYELGKEKCNNMDSGEQ